MTRLAILHPSDLLGEELKQEIGRRTALDGKLELFSNLEGEVGLLTESRGAAAMVQPYQPGELEGVDLAFFCGGIEATRPLLAELPAGTTAIVLSLDATLADGTPLVSGLNLEQARPGGVLLSLNPGAILLAQMISPLLPLAPRSASATVIEPASGHGKAALEELFEQARTLLTFSATRPEEIFGRQLAFNLYPVGVPGNDWAGMVAQVLGQATDAQLPLAIHRLQSGIFHGVSASLFLRFEDDPGIEQIRQALTAGGRLDLDSEDEPSPVDAAARGEVLVGSVEKAEGGYWLWATMDNLTLGGAVNAADIAEAVLAAARPGLAS